MYIIHFITTRFKDKLGGSTKDRNCHDENKQSIENTYNECIEENNSLLKYYEIIIDNYHYDSCNMSNNYFKH